jgi:hypothetical protein
VASATGNGVGRFPGLSGQFVAERVAGMGHESNSALMAYSGKVVTDSRFWHQSVRRRGQVPAFGRPMPKGSSEAVCGQSGAARAG